MAARIDHQYVHCCCVHSTHCEWRTIGPRVHITMERIEADRILPTHRPNTVVRHTKHQSSCHYQFLCILCYTAWLWQKWIPQRVNRSRSGQWGAHIGLNKLLLCWLCWPRLAWDSARQCWHRAEQATAGEGFAPLYQPGLVLHWHIHMEHCSCLTINIF